MTKLEEVARAAYEAGRERIKQRTGIDIAPWAEASADLRKTYLSSQRAAIAALRGPSEAMIEAVAAAGGLDFVGGDQPSKSFNVMLDALLAEPDAEIRRAM